MPIEVIEENSIAAQVRLRCDLCGVYIGTRIILTSELAAKSKTEMVCPKCKSSPSAGKKE